MWWALPRWQWLSPCRLPEQNEYLASVTGLILLLLGKQLLKCRV